MPLPKKGGSSAIMGSQQLDSVRDGSTLLEDTRNGRDPYVTVSSHFYPTVRGIRVTELLCLFACLGQPDNSFSVFP